MRRGTAEPFQPLRANLFRCLRPVKLPSSGCVQAVDQQRLLAFRAHEYQDEGHARNAAEGVLVCGLRFGGRILTMFSLVIFDPKEADVLVVSSFAASTSPGQTCSPTCQDRIKQFTLRCLSLRRSRSCELVLRTPKTVATCLDVRMTLYFAVLPMHISLVPSRETLYVNGGKFKIRQMSLAAILREAHTF